MSMQGSLTDQLTDHTKLHTSRPSLFSLGSHNTTVGVAPSYIIEALPSPEDGINKSLVIDMKDIVGDAVGNMSIGPSYRDLVLAARNGLFIIDLKAPSDVPRFLPQGGTWDVADVQWNPHPARAEYIVSTSSEKLLIWNLCLMGKSAIQHALHSHYPGGTQVKWNRQDGNVLASSHLNEVLIWDRRKGSIPLKSIKAHAAKIYGIDWAHNSFSGASFRHSEGNAIIPSQGSIYEPYCTIHTSYPVWRARDLPFGKGLLSLPQRGGDALEMWAHSTEAPHASVQVEAFEGHADVVKEFVWRRGGRDWGDFQLITWSKDKTLRFWPIDQDILQPDRDPPPRAHGYGDNSFSFRTPSEASYARPALSAPIGQRGILAEVRATHFGGRLPNPVLVPLRCARDTPHAQQCLESEPEQTPTVTAISVPPRYGGTMSLRNRSARIDSLAWLSSFRVGERFREGSPGGGSGVESGDASRIGSRSRPRSREANTTNMSAVLRRRSDSRGHWDDESEKQSLQDEITSVVTRLQQESSRIKLEKHDLVKRRTCTLGLNGPWGESSSVFVRVSFTFPKSYPHELHPGGTPMVDLERSPLISIRNRAFMLRRLRMLRETRRPCLEACLRFLLYGNEDEKQRRTANITKSRNTKPIVKPLHRDKNIAEPVTSQGVFGPNGQLVCFSRAPPRIVRNPLHELTSSAPCPADSIPRLFQSPALISDAVRRLALASSDSRVSSGDTQHGRDGDNILHVITNLLLSSRLKQKRPSEQSRPLDDIPANYSLLPTHAMTVFVRDAASITDLGQELAGEYVLDAPTPSEACNKNAEVARRHGRRDHEDFFRMFCENMGGEPSCMQFHQANKFAQEKNIQMLAMVAVLLLKISRPVAPSRTFSGSCAPLTVDFSKGGSFRAHAVIHRTPPARQPQNDGYVAFRPCKDGRRQSSPPWMNTTSSPPGNIASTSFTSISSRGSWSSLFNTGNVRQLIGSSPDAAREGGQQQTEPTPDGDLAGIPVPKNYSRKFGDVDSPQLRPTKSDSPQRLSPSARFDVGSARSLGSTTPTAGRGRRPTFSQVAKARHTTVHKSVVFVDPQPELQQELGDQAEPYSFASAEQLVLHVLAYAEVLFRWRLLHKRIELLKAVDQFLRLSADSPFTFGHSELGISILCIRCGQPTASCIQSACTACGTRLEMPQCSICRLPVKGLSFHCLSCHHVSHLSCWRSRQSAACTTGCSCHCGATLQV
ncbi:hypothetical protein F5148DRAFT_1276407 [Russula earlei]|uniref:Uncharacterized protein n=1 Tax=Russula earlei TaxID=71964 RepID=A0ACC0U674_9AGAM|nr:hypothetical protein F5148DRAFT_1276407 [Russula earlei]